MARLLIMVVVLIVSGIVFLVKATAKKVTGGDAVSFKGETQKVMDKTAKGVNWMNEQWDEANIRAKQNNKLN